MNSERKLSRADVEHYDLEILLRRPSLRTNIPRRSSQAYREIIQTKETTCGIGCIRGEWLQSFANRKAFIFTYGILGCFYGSYYTYFYGTITSLEKRFKISSQTIGTVAYMSDIIQVIMCLILSKYLPRNYKPKWIGFGIYIVILSTIFATSVHFLYESEYTTSLEKEVNNTYLNNNTFETRHQICSHELLQYDNDNKGYMPIIILVVAQTLNGIGGSFYFILGANYKDENINKHQAPAVLSLLFILKALGPAFGYWLSSLCLKIFSLPLIPPFINESYSHWIGAWWLGYPIVGFMLLIPATIMILFPNILQKTEFKRKLNGKKENMETKSNFVVMKDTTTKFKWTFLNSTFTCNNFTGIFNILGHTAYFIFLPKYAIIQYRISDSDANFFIGSITLLISTIGIIIASSIISKHKPKPGTLVSWNMFVGIMSIGCLTFYIYAGCSKSDAQLKAFTPQETKLNSTLCKYSNVQFLPVCSENGDAFISPCQAECNYVLYTNNTKVYADCNHISLNSSKSKTVIQENCFIDCHFNFIIFMIVTCSIGFMNATSLISNFLLKINPRSQQNCNLLTFGITCLRLVSLAPYSILFGYILDKSCLIWDNNCEQSGNCWLYDNKKLRFTMNLTAIGFVAIGIVFNLGVWFLVKDIEAFDDDDDGDENEEEN